MDELAQKLALMKNRVWTELTVVRAPAPANPQAAVTGADESLLFLKLITQPNSYYLLLTDLVGVWWHQADAAAIEEARKKFCPSLRQGEASDTIGILATLLEKQDASKRYYMEQKGEDGCGEMALTARMTIQAFTLSWQFTANPVGTSREQALVLREQMFLPLRHIVKLLSFQIHLLRQQAERSGPKQTAALASSAASSVEGAHSLASHGSAAHHTISTSPHKHQQQLQRRHESEQESYEQFSLSYSFHDTLGELYQGPLGKLSGDEMSIPARNSSAADLRRMSLLLNGHDPTAAGYGGLTGLGMESKHAPQPQAEGGELNYDEGEGEVYQESAEEIARREALKRKMEQSKQKKKKKKKGFV
eukprot:g37642.t1